MTAIHQTPRFFEEVTEFFASLPTHEQILHFRPSEEAQHRARDLLEKLKTDQLTEEERWELDQFSHAEQFLGLIKARLWAQKAAKP